MSALTTTTAIHTLDNRVLFPAGAVISPETLEPLISSHASVSYDSLSLLRYGSVREDLADFLNAPHYRMIFSGEERTAAVFNDLERVRLISPLMDVLDYFKANDFYTYRHFLAAFALSSLMAHELVPDHAERNGLVLTGPIHDVGKICMPLHVLKKAAPLTREEREILTGHTTAGYALLGYYLRDSQSLSSVIARDHHERIDGSGRPRGIRLEDLLVEIVAASDVYDALLSPRPYRPSPYDNRTALEVITEMAEGGQLGWDVVKTLVALNRKDKPRYDEVSIPSDKRGVAPADNQYGKTAEDETPEDETSAKK
ncbi:MAG: HD domain-containing phosphohydrolase [Thermodesulfobacteriota bacterium]